MLASAFAMLVRLFLRAISANAAGSEVLRLSSEDDLRGPPMKTVFSPGLIKPSLLRDRWLRRFDSFDGNNGAFSFSVSIGGSDTCECDASFSLDSTNDSETVAPLLFDHNLAIRSAFFPDTARDSLFNISFSSETVIDS